MYRISGSALEDPRDEEYAYPEDYTDDEEREEGNGNNRGKGFLHRKSLKVPCL